MKIPEKPVLPTSRGAVIELQDVKDSGPTQRKEGRPRIETEISAQTAEWVSLLREGHLTPVQVIHRVVDSIVARYASTVDAGTLREVLLQHLQKDPALRRLVVMTGVSITDIDGLENTGKNTME